VTVRIALSVKMDAVATVQDSFTVWHTTLQDNKEDKRPPPGAKLERYCRNEGPAGHRADLRGGGSPSSDCYGPNVIPTCVSEHLRKTRHRIPSASCNTSFGCLRPRRNNDRRSEPALLRQEAETER
jgi:hypothetical protein